jgi:hypothetical protein
METLNVAPGLMASSSRTFFGRIIYPARSIGIKVSFMPFHNTITIDAWRAWSNKGRVLISKSQFVAAVYDHRKTPIKIETQRSQSAATGVLQRYHSAFRASNSCRPGHIQRRHPSQFLRLVIPPQHPQIIRANRSQKNPAQNQRIPDRVRLMLDNCHHTRNGSHQTQHDHQNKHPHHQPARTAQRAQKTA